MPAKKILIIDDDVELCEEFENLLKDEGYDAASASDSKIGLALLKKHNYDILILDNKMQGYTGIDILKMIKESGLKISVFLISGRPFIKNLIEEENLSAFVSEIMNKPIDFEALLEKIKAQK